MKTIYLNLKRTDCTHNSFAVIAYNGNDDAFIHSVLEACNEEIENENISLDAISHILKLIKLGGSITSIFNVEYDMDGKDYEEAIEIEETWLY